ncbi:MAG: endonuclease [Microbacteriaceae bacterium]|nr:endonuclease [Microbacteriaceae bacterium]
MKVPTNHYFLDDHCANCLKPLPEDVEALFCSTWCNEIAGAVRYQRGAVRDGRINDPDVREAIMVKNAFLLAGGYQALGRTLPTSIRLEVKTRDAGKCQVCGKTGTDIDHIDGSSADLDNLQLLCADCHHAKTATNLVPASEEQRAWLLALNLTRVMPPKPALLADDQNEWQHAWRGLKTARKQRLLDYLTTAGIPAKGLKTRIDMINARDKWAPTATRRAVTQFEEDDPIVDWSWKAGKGLRPDLNS